MEAAMGDPENLTRETVKHIAREAAQEAVHETFLVLGIDLNNRNEVKSLQRALALASSADATWRTFFKSLVTNAGVAAASVVITYFALRGAP
jgi:hypothetical protein